MENNKIFDKTIENSVYIGPLNRLVDWGMISALNCGLERVDLEGLDALLRTEPHPERIYAPLISSTCDAIDIARLLAARGYRGMFVALTDSLPRPKMVLNEIRRHCRGVQVALHTFASSREMMKSA